MGFSLYFAKPAYYTASLMNRIDRLFAILLTLQHKRRVRAQDLAQQFELSKRTIYRDMSALNQMGFRSRRCRARALNWRCDIAMKKFSSSLRLQTH